MMFSVSTLFLAALVFNAALTFGAPLRIPDTGSVTARSEDSSIAARTPVVEKRDVRIVSDRGTPFAKPVTPTEVPVKAREEPGPQLVRRYPRKVYYNLYEKREPEPEPATTIKESTMITKLTTYDTPADAAAHAKAVGADSVTSTVVSSSQTTTLATPEVSPPARTAGPDTVATPSPTPSTTTTDSTTTPTPSPTEVTPSSTTTESGSPDEVATPSPLVTGTPTPTPTPGVDVPPSTPSDHLASHNPPVRRSSTDGDGDAKPMGKAATAPVGDASANAGKLKVTTPSRPVGKASADAPVTPPPEVHEATLSDSAIPLGKRAGADIATSSGRQVASSGAAFASAMRRRDLSSSSSSSYK